MVAVGLVWGATNALMRRGALVWDRRSRCLPAGTGAVRRWADLPVTNATTFAATAVAAALLGEATRAAPAALGTALILLGVWVCIS
ncbi:unnamed protein product [Triticum turgidum subsp. durum]|uniref:Uncharacterized protein n=1 Tax=Triticum turgidum subsp. durum TaxID=4567 RepID=A0A9R1PE31_TRITD|nr:unnamed protein product [Triticum turgidum subsp. durum]